MGAHWVWWILAALMIGAELLTGTVYLFAIGIAMALGGLAAFAGADMPMQFTIAGVLAVVLTFGAHQWRRRYATPPAQPALDVGQAVRVREWRDDGRLRVAYRGTEGDAELARPDIARADTLFIVKTRGSVLVVSDRRPAAP
jgi:membrane protein implicated in regulation of membrane protease activity